MYNKICCIVVTYNCDKEFIHVINGIKDEVDEVVIVDNGSNVETINILNHIKNQNKKVKLILNNENLGIATALNKGIEYSIENNYQWIITLDDDSICTKDMIKTMFNAYNQLEEEDRNKVVSILPKFVDRNLDNNHTLNKDSNVDVKYVVSGITSGNIVKVSLFKKIGLFNEKFFIDYVDHEFCLRIVREGYKILQVNNAILSHSLGESKKIKIFNKEITYTNHSYIRRYYITRNRLYVWKSYEKIEPKFIKRDKIGNLQEIIKILLFEKNKIKKFKMIYKGYSDYKNHIYGKINFI